MIFRTKPGSMQQILESVSDEAKLQVLVLATLALLQHNFADTSSKTSVSASTSNDTSPGYDPSTNSPPPKMRVRSEYGLFVAGKRTSDGNVAGVNVERFWQGRRADHKALRGEGRKLAHRASSRWKFPQLEDCTRRLRAQKMKRLTKIILNLI